MPAARSSLNRSSRHLAIVLAVAWLLVAAPAGAHAREPVLVLPGSWYRITEPYRYDEARRFERGWNRGADAVVAGGVARAPAAGVVRYAGTIAGTNVVTVATTLAGEPAVLTFTGLDSIAVQEGARLRMGDHVGDASELHVGAYDPRRRSRYWPVAGTGSAAGADTAVGAGDRSRPLRSTSAVADGVAKRIVDAIDGNAAFSGVVGNAGRGGAAAPRGVGGNAPTLRGARAAGIVANPFDAVVGSARQLAARSLETLRVPKAPGSSRAQATPAQAVSTLPGERASARGAVDQRPDAASPASGTARVPGDTASRLGAATGVIHAPAAVIGSDDAAARSVARSTGAVVRARPGAASAAAAASVVTPPVLGWSSVAVAAAPLDGDDVVTRRDAEPATTARASSGGALVEPRRVTLGFLLLAVAVVAALARRRTRRGGRRRAPRAIIHAPLPVHVPSPARRYAYPVIRADGASVLDDVALAWPDAVPGTSPDIEPHMRATARAPEHA